MSRKDYELIAKALREAHFADPEHNDRVHKTVAAKIAKALAAANPCFDMARFLAAAGAL